jgi:hypothetical protein
MGTFFERGLAPKESDETATVTFIKVNAKSFAVTAWHVVEIFEKQAEEEKCGPEAYCVPANRGCILEPPFVRPPAHFLQGSPDVAIRPIDEGLPASIGKEAFEIRASPQPAFPLSHALAVGFPTGAKRAVKVQGTEQVSLPCAWAVAEGVGGKDATADQVQFLSLLSELPDVRALSGMSGGPVFWSNGATMGSSASSRKHQKSSRATAARVSLLGHGCISFVNGRRMRTSRYGQSLPSRSGLGSALC